MTNKGNGYIIIILDYLIFLKTDSTRSQLSIKENNSNTKPICNYV